MNNKVLEELKQEYNEALNRAQDIGEIIANCADIDTHHCGQDAGECKVSCGELEATVSFENLLGMEVVGYGGSKTKCKGCPLESDSCVKVELVGGDYLCLAKPQEDEQPVISFDKEEGNVMDDIRKKAEAFMDYLDSIVSNGKD